MRRLGTTPVITLCCAPDWMTRLGTPTSHYPLLPPTEAHVRDFADLAARVARRYPDVRRFVVWNEMKGLWDPQAHAWDVQRYTRLYNAVHDALKAVDPGILVGGPYLNVRGTGSRSLGRHGHQTADPLLGPTARCCAPGSPTATAPTSWRSTATSRRRTIPTTTRASSSSSSPGWFGEVAARSAG